jgi:prepilin-type N-terminal cleavage/methylation domain
MKKQTGFTLIEIMIALLLGLLVLAAVIGIYITTIRGSTDTVRSTRLNHDLDSALLLMVNDIRRAGYWGGAIAGANSQNNPFTAATTNVQIHLNGDCILYTYDADGNGVVNNNEYFGFRLNGNAIQMRITNDATTDRTTAIAGCNSNSGWQTLTVNDIGSERINITDLTFSFNQIATPNLPATSKCLNTAILDDPENTLCADTTGYLNTGDRAIETRQVNIVIQGQSDNDATIRKTVSNSVRIRNDRIFVQP